MRVAFIGLGVMGFPMAGHLAKAGHQVSVFNRSPAKSELWANTFVGRACATVAEAAEGADACVVCVGNDDDVRQVVGLALPGMAAGGVVVDHTTTSAVVAREMAARAADVGRFFVDAPVSGGQAGAENGQLTIMCGGDPAAFAIAEALVSAYAKATRLMGGPGAGQLTKMVNQICIAGVVQGLAEGLHFAKRAGLESPAVYEAISKGAAQSWQMDNRWKTMGEGKFDFGFAVDWMRKDLGLVLEVTTLRTDRLVLTPVTTADVQFVLEILNDPGWLANIGDRGVRNPEQAKTYIAERFAPNFWVIARDADSLEPLGVCGVVPTRPGLEAPDLGYAFLARHSGKGYATEAAAAVLAYALGSLGHKRLMAITTLQNTPSQRVLEKIGFRRQADRQLPDHADASAVFSIDAPQ